MKALRATPAARAGRGSEAAPPAAPGREGGIAPPVPCTRAERIADGIVHALGVTLALMAAPVLITLAVLLDGSGPMIAGVSIYSVGLLLMLGCSAAYHLTPMPTWREALRRLDHAAIYVKIAATQTPFAVMIGGAGAGWLLGSVWTAALGGAAAKLFWPHALRRLSMPLYLALGWAGVALVLPGQDAVALDRSTVALVVVGGLLYTGGIAFLKAERLRFHNAIWHAFVLAATGVFYAAIAAEVGMRAAAAGG
ncbi:MAG: PAQR family membrane homeostasis protein TrhA [Pseudomonadota bacterium]